MSVCFDFARELPLLITAKFSDFLAPSPLAASAFPWPPSSDVGVITGSFPTNHMHILPKSFQSAINLVLRAWVDWIMNRFFFLQRSLQIKIAIRGQSCSSIWIHSANGNIGNQDGRFFYLGPDFYNGAVMGSKFFREQQKCHSKAIYKLMHKLN